MTLVIKLMPGTISTNLKVTPSYQMRHTAVYIVYVRQITKKSNIMHCPDYPALYRV